MTLLSQLQSQLQRYGLWAKKSLGQNFLVDEEALSRIVAAAELTADDHVVEVGAGTGLLTARLAAQCAHVTALEYDPQMIPILNQEAVKLGNVEVLHQDALKFSIFNFQFPISGYKLVANIPYYITSPLIKHFLTQEQRPKLVVLLIQKEVAEKICGKGGKTVLTIETQIFGQPDLVGIVKAESFYPAPKVDSAILRIRVFDKPLVAPDLMERFLKVLHAGYSQKRKKLSNSLASGLHVKTGEARDLVAKAGFPVNVRPEDLDVEDWKRLTKIYFGVP